MTNFLQKIFNQISLQRDEKLWMSSDDRLTSERLQLLAEFPETQFAPQLKLECIANAKNVKLSTGLREKGTVFSSIQLYKNMAHNMLLGLLFTKLIYSYR